jgi:hypothetical protein
MFIQIQRQGCDRDGQAFASGRFLVFMQPNSGDIKADTSAPIKCLVRFCAMRQSGHFMVGGIRVKGKTHYVSGAYGSDGLPISVDPQTYELGSELPRELYDAWKNGGGWNGAGGEAEAVRKWARETFS